MVWQIRPADTGGLLASSGGRKGRDDLPNKWKNKINGWCTEMYQ